MVQARFSWGYYHSSIRTSQLLSHVLIQLLRVSNPKYTEFAFDAGISYSKLHHWWADVGRRFEPFE